jgi:hypothetical protein
MKDSPIEKLMEALDRLDVEGLLALMAPDGKLLTADGQRAEGRDAVREVLSGFVAGLRSTSYRVITQWHQDNVWIAEVEVSYELRDWLRLNAIPRAFFVYDGPDGIADMHVYGAHERPITEHRTGEAGMRLGGTWVPPL